MGCGKTTGQIIASVDENTILPILKKLKEKTFVKTPEREERTKIVA